MPKTRINITPDEQTRAALIQAAKRDRVPVATKAADLLRLAVEMEEGLLLGVEADRHSAEKGFYLSREQVWR